MSDVTVLLVEDNHGDARLIERALDRENAPATVHTVRTGEEALDYLYRRDEFADAARPDLVLLDLNLPATSGHDVLEEVKSDPELRRTPVLILTGTRSEDDLVEAYDTHANACLVKPVDPDEFGDLVRTLVEFWMAAVTLPPGSDTGDES